MTEGQKMLRAVLEKSGAFAERWEKNAEGIAEEKLASDLVRRWSKNDADIEPSGLEAFPEFENWYDALELYLLSGCTPSSLANILVKAHLRAYGELVARAQLPSFLEFGDLWFFDITALARYRGEMIEEVLALLKNAAINASEAVPYTDDNSLKFFSDIYQRAAEVFVIDISERDLKNTAMSLGLARLPFEAHSILRDAFGSPSKLKFPDVEEADQRFLFLFDICISFFRKLQLFYSDPSNPGGAYSFRFDRWASRFDYPSLLFAGALPWELSDEAENLIAGICHNARKEQRHVIRKGWSPSVIRMRDQLVEYWRLSRHQIGDPTKPDVRRARHGEPSNRASEPGDNEKKHELKYEAVEALDKIFEHEVVA